MAQRPTRQKKDDRILHRGATANEIRADLSLAPFDKAVREMDKRWGVDRLPELVSVESAAKWGKAVAGLNGAIDAQDPDKVKFWVEVCLRGLTHERILLLQVRLLARQPWQSILPALPPYRQSLLPSMGFQLMFQLSNQK